MKIFLIFITILLFGFSGFAQDDLTSTLLSKIAESNKQYPQEKVYVQLDKPFYSIGDTIWLKAYVVNSEKNQPSALSQMVYVDLINPQDSLSHSLRLMLTGGTGHGQFVLTDSLLEGTCRIRGYTRWMQNFNPDYFFDKAIAIVNGFSSDIIAHASYTYSDKVNTPVNTKINYAHLSGRSISGQEVHYEVTSAGKIINQGKATTDAGGAINVSFIQGNKPVTIHTLVKKDEKDNIVKDITVPVRSGFGKVQFFPESGTMVKGIKSKIGFKAVGKNGLGTAIKGKIIDLENNQVAEFESGYAGMGNFLLVPQAGKIYTANITFADGSEISTSLPKAAESGYVLATTQDSTTITVKITTSKDLVRTGELLLVARSNGVVKYVAKKDLNATSFSTLLSISRFPEGILQFTLFSPQGDPVAERLVFVQHRTDRLKLILTPNKTSYNPHEKVQMTLAATDAGGRPVEGDFSVSVTDGSQVIWEDDKQTSILSNLLLTSELKGFVETPNYYFNQTNAKKLEQLDNLLLTQGWRRFAWKDLLSGKQTVINYKPEQGIEVTGLVTNLKDQPLNKAKVLLINTAGSVISTTTDKAGRFKLDSLDFKNDEVRFTIQATDSLGKREVKVKLDKSLSPEISPIDYPTVTDPSVYTYLENSNKRYEQMRTTGQLKGALVLNEVTVSGKQENIREQVLKRSANLNGPGRADNIFTFVDLQRCSGNLSTCMQNLMAGFKFNYNGSFYSTKAVIDPKDIARDLNSGTMYVKPVLLIMNGMPIEEPSPTLGEDFYAPILSVFRDLQSSEIESIEVLDPGPYTTLYGNRASNGAIVVTTKSGKFDYSEFEYKNNSGGIPQPIINSSAQGYHVAKEFYSPSYPIATAVNKAAPDLRNTIYWNPNVRTNELGKANFEFHQTDTAGKLQVIIEGLDEEGKLGRALTILEESK